MRPILYAEDEADDVFFLKLAFKEAGTRIPIQIVDNGLLAVQYLSGVPPFDDRDKFPLPCLVLLDLKLPIKNGLEVLKWIRSTPAFSALPVIMLTSSNADTDIHRAYAQGANSYLVKPGNPTQLAAMVKSLVDYWTQYNRSGIGLNNGK